MNIYDLHSKLTTQTIPMRTHTKVPDPLDLTIEDFPFALEVDGRKYLVLDSDAIDRCGKLMAVPSDRIEANNRESDASRQELQCIRDEIEHMMGVSKMTKDQIKSRLAKLHEELGVAIDNLPWME
jgi:hypothetical protein